MQPSELTAAAGRMRNDELRETARRPGARRWETPWRRGLGEQLEAIRRRLELGRRRRPVLSQIAMGRYTGARV